jgi:Uma2 family endonuclease
MAARPDFEPLAPPPTYPTTWDELCDDPRFQDLPYKVELLAGGRLLMTPHKPVRSRAQMRLIKLLEQHAPNGEISIEYAIKTADGVRVADVVWMTSEQFAIDIDASFAVHAPAICIEVASAGNSREELLTKAELYFQAGAKEVWICTDGTMEFLPGPSQLASSFPPRVDLE